ncbi:hypothetical protein, partial [Pseudomonas syringae group genomosp. 7]|uniref:hypothetical protein n=1 Tax=Pseudomonas syringae group genomosp. 7 TaxID=251699 RepID=UPI00376F46E3
MGWVLVFLWVGCVVCLWGVGGCFGCGLLWVGVGLVEHPPRRGGGLKGWIGIGGVWGGAGGG